MRNRPGLGAIKPLTCDDAPDLHEHLNRLNRWTRRRLRDTPTVTPHGATTGPEHSECRNLERTT